jgi:hypothetical protein
MVSSSEPRGWVYQTAFAKKSLAESPEQLLKEAPSLSTPLHGNRSCEAAGIDPLYCALPSQWDQTDCADNPTDRCNLLEELAGNVLRFVNSHNAYEKESVCEILTLKNIRVVMQQEYTFAFNFKQTKV